jgi:nucleoside-diphosphate-sugar epimerase
MILVTGANGKLGRALVEHFVASGQGVHAAARAMPVGLPEGATGFAVGPLSSATDWRAALSDVATVIHCAALTWIDPEATDQTGFQTVNVDATERLARRAAESGVKRLVYISSLTVNGKHSGAQPFRHDDVPNPGSPYSRSKWDAEQALRRIEAETGLEIVVVRPPRIIWPELTGNLALMAKLIKRGIPLPFGLLDKNVRDNISAVNLVEAIARCAAEPEAAGKTQLVSDGTPMSTRALAVWLGERVGRKAKLLPVPERLLRLLITVVPRRLLGSLNRKEMLDELVLDLKIDRPETEEHPRMQAARPVAYRRPVH